jgi:hypothetical protein
MANNNAQGVSMLRNSNCFKLKIDHENPPRNKAKNKVLNP